MLQSSINLRVVTNEQMNLVLQVPKGTEDYDPLRRQVWKLLLLGSYIPQDMRKQHHVYTMM